MIVKQYTVTLPADYDMAIIRNRVASKGPGFDDFPGLGLKIFMIREKGRFGAESNQYAPVYLWPEIEPMWGFVAGDGFRGILDAFGRVPIRYWLGFAYARAEGIDLMSIRSVSREEARIDPGTDLAGLRRNELEQARAAVASTAGLLARAVGVDTECWSLVRFDYWAREQSSLPEGTRSYEALHISAPDAEKLRQT
jgi:hypothetical protein